MLLVVGPMPPLWWEPRRGTVAAMLPAAKLPAVLLGILLHWIAPRGTLAVGRGRRPVIGMPETLLEILGNDAICVVG